MVKKSKQQTERLLYREGPHRSNDMNGGIHRSSSSTPYSSNNLDKEGYSAPFIPRSTSYVDYAKQYFSKSDASKSSANADTLSTYQRSVASVSPIVATYDYSPFGQLIATSGTPELSPIQFSSEVFDPEIALTYYNHRFYNPTDGHWFSRDPAGESASLNLYAFVKNAPNYRTDYLGLKLEKLPDNPPSPVFHPIVYDDNGKKIDGRFYRKIPGRNLAWNVDAKYFCYINMEKQLFYMLKVSILISETSRNNPNVINNENKHYYNYSEVWNEFVDRVNPYDGWNCSLKCDLILNYLNTALRVVVSKSYYRDLLIDLNEAKYDPKRLDDYRQKLPNVKSEYEKAEKAFEESKKKLNE